MTSPTVECLHSPAPATSFTSRFGSFDRSFWVVAGGTAVNRLGSMVVPYLVFFLASRGVATSAIPYVLGALGAGGLVGPILGGLVTDRVGGRPVLAGGLIATAVSQGLLYASPSLPTMVAAAMLLGASASVYPPAAGAVIAGAVGQADRRIAFAAMHWAINVGSAVAGALGGFLAERGYLLLFTLDVATCLAYAALAAVLLPHSSGPVKARPAQGGYGIVLRDRLALTLIALSTVGELVYAQTEFTLPLAIRDHGLPPTTFGLGAVVNTVMCITLQPFASAWTSRFNRVQVWALASVVITAGIALTGLAHTTGEFVLTVVVWSIGEIFVGGVVTSVVADLAPADAQGRYQGVLNWSRGLARFAALGGGSAVYAGFGPGVVWSGCAVGGVAGALLSLALVRRVAARTA